MSKKNRSSAKGLDALAGLLAPEPGDEVVEFAVRTLYEIPGFEVIAQVSELRAEAEALKKAADALASEIGSRQITIVENTPRVSKLQVHLHQYAAALKTKIFANPDIAAARALFEGKFKQMLDEAVAAAMAKDATAVRLQDELRTLTAEGLALMKANEQAQVIVASNRERAAELTKEADALLASIQ